MKMIASTGDTIYGDGRQLCLADRYHIQQDAKVREQQGSLQRAQEENQRLRSELLRRELASPLRNRRQARPPPPISPLYRVLPVGAPRTAGLARTEPAPSTHSCTRRICT